MIIEIAGISLVIIILLLVIVVMHSKNKKLKQILEGEKTKISEFRKRFDLINKNNPGKKELDELDSIARDLFNYADNQKYNLSYNELLNEFKVKGNEDKTEFCRLMASFIYTGKNSKKEDIKKAFTLFAKILDSELKYYYR